MARLRLIAIFVAGHPQFELCERWQGSELLTWDAARFAAPPSRDVFDPDWWRARGRLTGAARGRGSAYFVVATDDTPWVLRHNRRGGVLAYFNHDRFVWTGARRARALAELRLLAAMRTAALPVPAPVAARAARCGPWYRGDVITQSIVGATPLADALAEAPLAATAWRGLGATLARFHCAGIRHADLNARNVLVDAAGDFYLIDFDKAKRAPRGRWCEPNMARLKRSLDKFCRLEPAFNYCTDDWQVLRQGYQDGFAGAARP